MSTIINKDRRDARARYDLADGKHHVTVTIFHVARKGFVREVRLWEDKDGLSFTVIFGGAVQSLIAEAYRYNFATLQALARHCETPETMEIVRKVADGPLAIDVQQATA